MSDTKVISLPENGGSGSVPAWLPFLSGNGGWGGNLGGFGGGILGFFLGLLFGNNGFGGGLFGGNRNGAAGAAYLGNMISNDNGRELLMQAVTASGERSTDAIRQLATTLNQDFNQVNSAVQAISTQLCTIASNQGMSTLQVINAIQSGNASLGAQLCQGLAGVQATLERISADDKLAICQQTNTLQNGANANTLSILGKLDAIEDARKDREINALNAKVSRLESEKFSTGLVQNAVAPVLGQLANLANEVEAIKRCQPATITLPNNTYTAVPTIVANAGADFIASYWANRLSAATGGTGTTTPTTPTT